MKFSIIIFLFCITISNANRADFLELLQDFGVNDESSDGFGKYFTPNSPIYKYKLDLRS